MTGVYISAAGPGQPAGPRHSRAPAIVGADWSEERDAVLAGVERPGVDDAEMRQTGPIRAVGLDVSLG